MPCTSVQREASRRARCSGVYNPTASRVLPPEGGDTDSRVEEVIVTIAVILTVQGRDKRRGHGAADPAFDVSMRLYTPSCQELLTSSMLYHICGWREARMCRSGFLGIRRIFDPPGLTLLLRDYRLLGRRK